MVNFQIESVHGAKCIVEEVFGKTYISPPIPSNLRLVDNHEFIQSEQYFRRKGIPQHFKVQTSAKFAPYKAEIDKRRRQGTLSASYWEMINDIRNDTLIKIPGYGDYVQEEQRRRLDGYFFFNDGRLTYVTGKNYMQINWYCENSTVFDYRDVNRRIWYLWELVINDPDLVGLILLGPRRVGKTAMASCMLLDDVLLTKDFKCGIQSMDSTAAKSVFAKIVQAFKTYPWFFKPLYGGSDSPKESLDVAIEAMRSASDKDIFGDTASSKLNHNSKLDYRSSGQLAYDGEKMGRMFIDEFGKTSEVDVNKRHSSLLPTFRVNGELQGKMFATTTVELLETGNAYENGKKLWDNSKQRKIINEYDGSEFYGSVTQLYQVFVGYNQVFQLDKFGNPREEMANKESAKLRAIAKASGEPSELSTVIRQTCASEQEAFQVFIPENGLNVKKIEDQKQLVEANEREGIREYRPYSLEYMSDGSVTATPRPDIEKTKGVFERDPTALWDIACMPDSSELNLNRVRQKLLDRITGNEVYIKEPVSPFRFAMATDPIKSTDPSDSRASMAAIMVAARWPIGRMGVDGLFKSFYAPQIPFMVLHNRPKLLDYWEEVIKCCLLFGTKVLIEANAEAGLITHMTRRGMENYIFHKPITTDADAIAAVKQLQNNTQLRLAISATNSSNSKYFSELQIFVEERIDKVMHLGLLKQLQEFNIEATQKYDLVVCLGWLLTNANDRLVKLMNPQKPVSLKGESALRTKQDPKSKYIW